MTLTEAEGSPVLELLQSEDAKPPETSDCREEPSARTAATELRRQTCHYDHKVIMSTLQVFSDCQYQLSGHEG